jgi:hypothetical protein
MSMRRLLPLTAFLTLAIASAAQAADPPKGLIRAGKGMAGITIGQSQTQVKAVLGKPAKTTKGTNDFGEYTQLTFPGKLTVVFQGNTVLSSVSTTDDGQRTKEGIHVGSSETRAMQKIKGLRCEDLGDRRSCTLGRFQAGEHVTIFFVKPNGLINRITVATVID